MVSITLRVLSRPDVEHLPRIYQSLGLDYDERVLPSIGNEVLKSIVAQFDAAELITQREVVCDCVLYELWALTSNRCRLVFARTSSSVLESSTFC
jgi:prohibitin 1